MDKYDADGEPITLIGRFFGAIFGDSAHGYETLKVPLANGKPNTLIGRVERFLGKVFLGDRSEAPAAPAQTVLEQDKLLSGDKGIADLDALVAASTPARKAAEEIKQRETGDEETSFAAEVLRKRRESAKDEKQNDGR